MEHMLAGKLSAGVVGTQDVHAQTRDRESFGGYPAFDERLDGQLFQVHRWGSRAVQTAHYQTDPGQHQHGQEVDGTPRKTKQRFNTRTLKNASDMPG